jgi:hypothetical protein
LGAEKVRTTKVPERSAPLQSFEEFDIIMSADSTLLFDGVRYPVSIAELEQLDRETHPKVKLAKAARLKLYWSNHVAMTGGNEGSFLFIGALMGTFGLEGLLERRFSQAALTEPMEDVDRRLDEAGLHGQRALHVHYLPDY